MDIDSLKVNSTAIEEGHWVDSIPGMGELRLKVRGMSARAVVEARSAKMRMLGDDDRNRDGSPKYEHSLRITSEVLFESVLLDWDGISQGGKLVPYSKEKAKEWLTNPAYRKFADAVVWSGDFVDNRLKLEEEKAKGNSLPPSDGA